MHKRHERVKLDGRFYAPKKKISIAPGEHTVEISVANEPGFPAVFVGSDVYQSDKTWSSGHIPGAVLPVWWDELFDRAECCVELWIPSFICGDRGKQN